MNEPQTQNANLYNANIKERFLSEFGESTQNTYRRIFMRSKNFECQYDKDLYEFNAKEIGDLLYDLNPLTFASSATNTRIVSSYMYWAINMNLRGKNSTWISNPVENVDNAWIRKFVRPNTRIYLSENELRQVEDFCTNYQDAVIFRCLFEGIEGNELSELCNLQKKDINMSYNTLSLHDSNGAKRFLDVSDRCMDLIIGALDQRIYHKRNGYMDTDLYSNVPPTVRVAINNYVLRNNLTNTQAQMGPVSKNVIYHRITTIRNLFGETPDNEQGFTCQYLRPKNIVRSGMIWMGKKILDNKGSLTKEDYEAIVQRYNKNNAWSIKEFVNEELIKEIYGG